jgi:hypothetical protein
MTQPHYFSGAASLFVNLDIAGRPVMDGGNKGDLSQ